ncbi:oxidoreductase domain protein [Actinobacteria bacterium OK074]|nr:oxidoreductase domain protein [Actinobacteria bacterium OK074]
MTAPTGHSPHSPALDDSPTAQNAQAAENVQTAQNVRSAPAPAPGRARRPARLRVAVLGAGMIAGVHLRSARANGAEVVGVLSATPERSLAAAERWQVDVGYPDLDAVLADDSIDVVHVCTPNHLHVTQAGAALRAGKHVVCEKPLATTAADARLLVDAAESAGRIATVPFVYRYHPMVRELRARVAAGDFGAWQLLHGSYLQDWLLSPDSTSWRVDPAVGGASRAFADIGSHWFDLVEWVAGVRVAELLAETTTTVPDRPGAGGPTFRGPAPAGAGRTAVTTEDALAVVARTTDGVLVSTTVSQVSAGRKNRLWFELDGADASAVFDQELPESLWLGRPDRAETLVRDPSVNSPDAARLSVVPAGHPQGYPECFENFVKDTYAAVRGESPEGLPTVLDGLRSARLVDAVITSAARRAWTPVADDTVDAQTTEGNGGHPR